MKQELSKDGYERIEAHILAIENSASDGVFICNEKDLLKQLRKIIFETKHLRQTLREVIILCPEKPRGDAA
jgi:hypothetical protein